MIAQGVRTSAREVWGGAATRLVATPCPECGCGIPFGAEICEICLADLGERPMALRAADLPPAAADADLSFGDVIAELEALAQLATQNMEVAEVALRTGSLLARLRVQFMHELGVPGAAPETSSSAV